MKHLSQLVGCFLDIKYRPLLLTLNAIILQHPTVYSRILSLKFYHGLWRYGFKDEVIITMWAVLVAFFELLGIFAETLFALLACECHV